MKETETSYTDSITKLKEKCLSGVSTPYDVCLDYSYTRLLKKITNQAMLLDIGIASDGEKVYSQVVDVVDDEDGESRRILSLIEWDKFDNCTRTEITLKGALGNELMRGFQIISNETCDFTSPEKEFISDRQADSFKIGQVKGVIEKIELLQQNR